MTDLRSGLCHGPDCQAKITASCQSEDFCSDGCMARWQAANSRTEPLPADGVMLYAGDGYRSTGRWVQLDDSEYPDWVWVPATVKPELTVPRDHSAKPPTKGIHKRRSLWSWIWTRR